MTVASRFHWTKQELEVMEYWEMRERAVQEKRQAAIDKGKKMGDLLKNKKSLAIC